MNGVTTEPALDTTPIAGLLRLVIDAWHPDAVWLFGSRARGTAESDSDWDLLVVVPDAVAEGGATDPMVAWDLRRRAGVRADIIVCATSDFDDAKSVPNTLAYEAFHFGRRLLGR
jgi:predicted nucleotidyltransferase